MAATAVEQAPPDDGRDGGSSDDAGERHVIPRVVCKKGATELSKGERGGKSEFRRSQERIVME